MNLQISDWKRLGLELKLKFYDLDIIEKDHQGNTKEQVLQMFQLWLKKQPDASYEQLIKALHEVGDETVASFLSKKYGKYQITVSKHFINVTSKFFLFTIQCLLDHCNMVTFHQETHIYLSMLIT